MDDIANAIRECDFDRLYDKLNAYVIARLRAVNIKDFDGVEPQDFVSIVVEKALTSIRNWNSSKYTFEEFLFGSLKSDVDAFFKRKKSLIDSDDFDIVPQGAEEYLEDLKAQIHSILIDYGSDDNEILLFNLWAEGVFKRSDIAIELDMSEKEVDNIRKRLIRKLPHVRKMIKIS